MIVLTTFELDEYVFGALRAGAAGFLLKDVEPAELVDAVRVVAGRRGAARAAAHAPADRGVRRPGRGRPPPRDDAELEELTAARARGAHARRPAASPTREIAERLVLSPLTAKTHVARLFTKLGARDRAQLVVLAYETGLVVAGKGR